VTVYLVDTSIILQRDEGSVARQMKDKYLVQISLGQKLDVIGSMSWGTRPY